MSERRDFSIQNGALVSSRVIEEYSAPLNRVLDYLQTSLNEQAIQTDILPKGCKSVFRIGNKTSYVIEVSPGTFPLRWDDHEHDNGDEILDFSAGEVHVAMPWQYFVFEFVDAPPNTYGITQNLLHLKLFWAQQQIESYHSQVYVAKLPNIDSNSVVCLGDMFPESTLPAHVRMEEIVASFYDNSTFNHDLEWNVPYDGDHEYWETATERDPYCWKEWSDFYPMPLQTYLGINPTLPRRQSLEQILNNAVANVGAALW